MAIVQLRLLSINMIIMIMIRVENPSVRIADYDVEPLSTGMGALRSSSD